MEALNRLDEEAVVTEQLLKETRIGITLSNLKKHSNDKVAMLAKKLVKKWKEETGRHQTRKEHTATKNNRPPSPKSKKVLLCTPVPGKSRPSPLVQSSTATSPSLATAPSAHSPRFSPSPPPDPSASTVIPIDMKPLRTSVTDGVEFDRGPGKNKGKAVRAACAEQVYNALAVDSTLDSDRLLTVTFSIDDAVWSAFPPIQKAEHIVPSPQYKQKMLQLGQRIKVAGCAEIRRKIESGELEVKRLVEMGGLDFATDEQVSERNKLRQDSLKGAVASASEGGAYKEEQAWHLKGR